VGQVGITRKRGRSESARHRSRFAAKMPERRKPKWYKKKKNIGGAVRGEVGGNKLNKIENHRVERGRKY